jgi:hypothetical protein
MSYLTPCSSSTVLDNNMSCCIRIHSVMALWDQCCLALKWMIWLYNTCTLSGHHSTYFITLMVFGHGKPVGFIIIIIIIA